jgi:hypothetical protein
MLRRISVALAALAVAGTALVALTAQQVGASQEFSVVAHQTNFEFFPSGGQGTINPTAPPQIGDRFILRHDLFEGLTNVGYDNVVCTVTFNDNLLCDVMFALAGKGDLHGTALLRGGASVNGPPSVFDATIDGGTFAYASARGMIHITAVPDNQNGDLQDNFLIS